MAPVTVLVLIVVLVVGSHFTSPQWIIPIASNWVRMNDTLTITIVITGMLFVAINLFVVAVLLRCHRRGSQCSQRAVYKPHDKRLEWRLIGVTSVGVTALPTPGLLVYIDYIRPPPNALQMEVLGQQW